MIKLINQFISWFKGLFIKKLTVKQKLEKLTKENKPYRSLTQKRNDWLKSKGYTVRQVNRIKKDKKIILSPYQQAVLRFIELKRKGKIDIKPYRNKWGIPFYENKKSIAEQLHTN